MGIGNEDHVLVTRTGNLVLMGAAPKSIDTPSGSCTR